MTVIINLFGAPSAGKSTAQACLFSAMKNVDVRRAYGSKSNTTFNVETVSEYAKELAWQGIDITKEMQQSVVDVQIERERRLLDKVDYIITDSPVHLSAFYEHIHHDTCSTKSKIDTYLSNLREDGHVALNFFLKRDINVVCWNYRGYGESEKFL